MKKLFLLISFGFGLNVFAQQSNIQSNSYNQLNGNGYSSVPYACHFGDFKVVNSKLDGVFLKFNLVGKGTLVNSSGTTKNVSVNEKSEYLTLFYGTDLANNARIAAYCIIGAGTPNSPAYINFYVPFIPTNI